MQNKTQSPYVDYEVRAMTTKNIVSPMRPVSALLDEPKNFSLLDQRLRRDSKSLQRISDRNPPRSAPMEAFYRHHRYR
jgi:hypothetical protein